jgi:hypothetical protein
LLQEQYGQIIFGVQDLRWGSDLNNDLLVDDAGVIEIECPAVIFGSTKFRNAGLVQIGLREGFTIFVLLGKLDGFLIQLAG